MELKREAPPAVNRPRFGLVAVGREGRMNASTPHGLAAAALRPSLASWTPLEPLTSFFGRSADLRIWVV
jgi:hypothetical protein